MNRVSRHVFGSVQSATVVLAVALLLLPGFGYSQQSANPQPQPAQTSPRVIQQLSQQLFILEPMPGEKPELTEEQMEILLSQVVSPEVRPQVLVGTYQDFVSQYSSAKTRSAEEEVLFRLNRDAQSLRDVPIELIPPTDVQILPQPLDVDQRRWQVVKEWGVVPENRMGNAIDCSENPYGFAKARSLMITALVERTRGRIPDFDTAHAASFLRAFDRCMAEGPDGTCKLGIATDHPYLNWAIGGRGPAFNLHYVPDPGNEKAVNAKSLAVYDDVYGIWYDVGCACGGNIGEIAGAQRKITFTAQVNAPVCMLVQPINGTPNTINSANERPTMDYAASLRGDREILNGQWTLNGRTVPSDVRVISQGLENGTPYVEGQSIVHIPLKGLTNGAYELRYHAASKDRINPTTGKPYEVDCSAQFAINIPPPPPPPPPPPAECKTLTTKVEGDQVVNELTYANAPTLDHIDFVVLRKDGSTVTAVSQKVHNGEYRFPLRAITSVQPYGEFYVSAEGFDKAGKKLWECPANLNGPAPIVVTEPCPDCSVKLMDNTKVGLKDTAGPYYQVTLNRPAEMATGRLMYEGKVVGTGLMDRIDLKPLPHDQKGELIPGEYHLSFEGQSCKQDGSLCKFTCELVLPIKGESHLCKGVYLALCLAPLAGLAAFAHGGKNTPINKPPGEPETPTSCSQVFCTGVVPNPGITAAH